MLFSLAQYTSEHIRLTNEISAYNITADSWFDATMSGEAPLFDPQTNLSWLSWVNTETSLESPGFAMGGNVDKVDGMAKFDTSDPRNPKWWNETRDDLPKFRAGGPAFTRLGPKGTILYFGGFNSTPDAEGNFTQRDMSYIDVYNIDTATWHHVIAGGDTPQIRVNFCLAVSSAPDDSSFQITLYGGWDQSGNHAYADTYILSVPSFQWINVTDPFSPDINLFIGATRPGRHTHSCVSYRDRQMLILGGLISDHDRHLNIERCSAEYPLLRALDLSTLEWQEEWNANPKKYVVPKAVRSVIGGGPGGGATMTQPTGGFNDPDLSTALAQVAPRRNPEDGMAEETDDTNEMAEETDGTNDMDAAPTKPPVYLVAGGVVGGVLGLAVIIAIAVFLILKRRRQREEPKHQIHGSHDRASIGEGSGLCNHQSSSELPHNNMDEQHVYHSSEIDGNQQRTGRKCEIHSHPRQEIDGREVKELPSRTSALN